jgi:hypothetical protein
MTSGRAVTSGTTSTTAVGNGSTGNGAVGPLNDDPKKYFDALMSKYNTQTQVKIILSQFLGSDAFLKWSPRLKRSR